MPKKKFKDTTVGKLLLGAAKVINPALGEVLEGVVSPKDAIKEITKSGMSREKAYKLVQSHAKKSLASKINLIELLKKDKNITNKISIKKIDKIFNYNKHFKNVGYIFKRVFK